jgi:hypothetical protein
LSGEIIFTEKLTAAKRKLNAPRAILFHNFSNSMLLRKGHTGRAGAAGALDIIYCGTTNIQPVGITCPCHYSALYVPSCQ